jgi:integrase
MKFEKEVEEYLGLKSTSTAEAYSAAFKSFVEFYGEKYGADKGLIHFLDRIYEEFKKPIREQGHVAEKELIEFIDYLKKKGKADNSIRLYFAAIQNFLKWKHVSVSMSFIGNMPKPHSKKSNGKHEWRIEQIKEFVEAAPSYREKAIILCMFQSGLAVNEICELNYGDIKDELESVTLPLCLRLDRKKTGVEFKTFFGRDAVKYLKLYLATRGKLRPSSPLFTKQRARKGETRITPTLIQQSFVEIAKNLDFIDNDKEGYNPARPHSLRAAFNSRLIGKIDETLREFWMGHAIGAVKQAYLNMPTEELRKLYMTAEEYLCIEKTSREEIEDKGKTVKLPPEVEEKIKILEDEVEKQRDEIASLKVKMEGATEIIHTLEPILETFIEFADTSEFQRFRKAKRLKEMKEAQQDDNELKAEVGETTELSEAQKEKLKKIVPK